VVDLRARFHLPPVERGMDARMVVVSQQGRSVALLVDSAREVIRLDPETFRPPPEIVLREARGCVRQVAQAGSRLLLLIDFDKVIGEEEIHHGAE
jgi:purine-binding chemotaxis protein CheW